MKYRVSFTTLTAKNLGLFYRDSDQAEGDDGNEVYHESDALSGHGFDGMWPDAILYPVLKADGHDPAKISFSRNGKLGASPKVGARPEERVSIFDIDGEEIHPKVIRDMDAYLVIDRIEGTKS
jgi:hypothetical protein